MWFFIPKKLKNMDYFWFFLTKNDQKRPKWTHIERYTYTNVVTGDGAVTTKNDPRRNPAD